MGSDKCVSRCIIVISKKTCLLGDSHPSPHPPLPLSSICAEAVVVVGAGEGPKSEDEHGFSFRWCRTVVVVCRLRIGDVIDELAE